MADNQSDGFFWIINISKKIISLSDLRFNIPPMRPYNLLDKRHFKYTLEQLETSLESGSLSKRKDAIKIMLVPPEPIEPIKKEVYDRPLPSRVHFAFKMEEPVYEELIVSEEDYVKDWEMTQDDIEWNKK